MKRCVCGKSASMPLCDGSHVSEGWVCTAQEDSRIGLSFAASANLQNLADRLAHRFGGTSLSTTSGQVAAERLIVITDGQDVTALRGEVSRVHARQRTLITVGMDRTVAQWAFSDFDTVSIEDAQPAMLWRAAVAAVDEAPAAPSPQAPPRVFLSHAVADEGRIFPVIEALRRDFGVHLFVCADSISSGARWHDEIRAEIEDCDAVIFMSSKDANVSVFCAFEVGYATALGKALHVIGLDTEGPPSHLSEVQAIDLSRLQVRKPWLGPTEALLEAFLTVLGD